MALLYKRVLIKVSGEIFSKDSDTIYNPEYLNLFIKQVLTLKKEGLDIAIVIGGGNIFRGIEGKKLQLPRVSADFMGMLATLLNGIVLKETFEKQDQTVKLISAIKTSLSCFEQDNPILAKQWIDEGQIIVFAGGTGHPYFTTDTTAALRALEIGADVLFKATKVDGVFAQDPNTNPQAEHYDEISYIDYLKNDLKVMDASAISLCRDNKLPIKIFNIFQQDALLQAAKQLHFGSLITGESQ